MKKALLFLASLVILLSFTNPPVEKHRKAVEDDLEERLYETDEGRQLLKTMDASYIKGYNQQAVEDKVSSKNYYLFSLTRITYPETNPVSTRYVGVGLLGTVFLYSGM
jgi:hypothetical protein